MLPISALLWQPNHVGSTSAGDCSPRSHTAVLHATSSTKLSASDLRPSTDHPEQGRIRRFSCIAAVWHAEVPCCTALQLHIVTGPQHTMTAVTIPHVPLVLLDLSPSSSPGTTLPPSPHSCGSPAMTRGVSPSLGAPPPSLTSSPSSTTRLAPTAPCLHRRRTRRLGPGNAEILADQTRRPWCCYDNWCDIIRVCKLAARPVFAAG